MKIAVGDSRMQKKWKNKEMSWEEFSGRCENTIRTTETIAEYRKMSNFHKRYYLYIKRCL